MCLLTGCPYMAVKFETCNSGRPSWCQFACSVNPSFQVISQLSAPPDHPLHQIIKFDKKIVCIKNGVEIPSGWSDVHFRPFSLKVCKRGCWKGSKLSPTKPYFGGGDSRCFGPKSHLFLDWCGECFHCLLSFTFLFYSFPNLILNSHNVHILQRKHFLRVLKNYFFGCGESLHVWSMPKWGTPRLLRPPGSTNVF